MLKITNSLIKNHTARSNKNLTRYKWYDNLVLNIPHSSIDGLGSTRWNNSQLLASEVKKWTNWFTDLIFIPSERNNISILTSDYSRFVVDVYPDNPFLGTICTNYKGLHRDIDDEERMELLRYYNSYINKLIDMLNAHSLLINCQSYPSELCDADIYISFNDDYSKPSEFVLDLTFEFFRKKRIRCRYWAIRYLLKDFYNWFQL